MLSKIKDIAYFERAIALFYFIAAFPLPDTFYYYFRFIVFFAVGFILLKKNKFLDKIHTIFLLSVLIIDNPFIPIHFPIALWVGLDIIIGTYLIYLSTRFKKKIFHLGLVDIQNYNKQ